MDPDLLVKVLIHMWILLTETSGNTLPNLGDVRIFNENTDEDRYAGEAQIYISNGDTPNSWSKMCNRLNTSSTISFSSHEAVTFCMQLGYADGEVIFRQETSDYPIWIANINCHHTHHPHILRCDYEIGDYSECSQPVFVKCSTQETAKWNGSLEFCPPNDLHTSTYLTSASFGVVGIQLHGALKAISSSRITLGGSKLADLMCTTMGFQKAVPGSIKSLQVYNTTDFSICQSHYGYQAWIGLSDMECDPERENSCIGCCFENPAKELCGGSDCAKNFLIIQCTFDMFESLKSFQPACRFLEYSNSSSDHKIFSYDYYCSLKSGNWKIIVGFAASGFCSIFLCIVCTPGFIYGIYKFKKDHNRHHREDPLL